MEVFPMNIQSKSGSEKELKEFKVPAIVKRIVEYI
jgi:hypothetical protein